MGGDEETEVDPHSMSAEPSMIAWNRVRVSTGILCLLSALNVIGNAATIPINKGDLIPINTASMLFAYRA
jgi:hypothetical protein